MKVLYTAITIFSFVLTTGTYNSAEAAVGNNVRLSACYENQDIAPHMLAAVPIIQSLKDTFPDLGACEEWARTPQMMIDGGMEASVATLLARTCGECTCRLAF